MWLFLPFWAIQQRLSGNCDLNTKTFFCLFTLEPSNSTFTASLELITRDVEGDAAEFGADVFRKIELADNFLDFVDEGKIPTWFGSSSRGNFLGSHIVYN